MKAIKYANEIEIKTDELENIFFFASYFKSLLAFFHFSVDYT